ncbi:MAG TPA: hypothetical protein VG318_02410 [Actinomycetota bacterium]|nr:hypothetical protein [Actinomycetota bacterium]
MLLFRSEEHLERWLGEGRGPRGERFDLAVQWDLAQAWFTGRDRPEWKKRTAAGAEEVFRSAGLTGPFWTLT